MSFDCTLNMKADLHHDYKTAFNTLSTNTHNVEDFIGAVDSITPVTLDEGDETVFTENRWVVGGKYIPTSLTKLFGVDELAALTHVTWEKGAYKNTWTMDLETVDYFDVEGVIDFTEENEGDIVTMTIHIKADHIPMLPGFLEGTAESTVKTTLESVFNNALQTIADNMDTLIEYKREQNIEKVAV